MGTFLVVQWVRLLAPNAGDLGLIPGQETGSHMPQLRVRMIQLRSTFPINKYFSKSHAICKELSLFLTIFQFGRGA